MNCIFCDIINNKKPAYKVWEDDRFLVILDIHPINPGHLLLLPKDHFEDLYNIPDPLYGELFQAVKKVSTLLKKTTSALRIGMAVEGFGVPHVHIHLVPVNSGNELNPERAKKVLDCELQEMCKNLSAQFKSS